MSERKAKLVRALPSEEEEKKRSFLTTRMNGFVILFPIPTWKVVSQKSQVSITARKWLAKAKLQLRISEPRSTVRGQGEKTPARSANEPSGSIKTMPFFLLLTSEERQTTSGFARTAKLLRIHSSTAPPFRPARARRSVHSFVSSLVSRLSQVLGLKS